MLWILAVQKVATGHVSSDGIVVCQRNIRTNLLPNGKTGFDAIEAGLKDCIKEIGMDLLRIGIGCTGPVDPVNGVIGKVAILPDGWSAS